MLRMDFAHFVALDQTKSGISFFLEWSLLTLYTITHKRDADIWPKFGIFFFFIQKKLL